MQISSTRLQQTPVSRFNPQTPATQEAVSDTPSDSVTFGGLDSKETLGMIGLGTASGVIGIGAPAALGLGAIKAFASGNTLAGVGLAAGAVVAGGTVGAVALMGAAMSTGSGETNIGFNSYLAAGAVTTLAAGVAIF